MKKVISVLLTLACLLIIMPSESIANCSDRYYSSSDSTSRSAANDRLDLCYDDGWWWGFAAGVVTITAVSIVSIISQLPAETSESTLIPFNSDKNDNRFFYRTEVDFINTGKINWSTGIRW